MKIIYTGFRNPFKDLGEQVFFDEPYRLSNYCFKVKVDEGVLIYNLINDYLILLKEEEINNFVNTVDAKKMMFSVPNSFNERFLFFSKIKKDWKKNVDFDKDYDAIKELALSIYMSYLREIDINKKRLNIYSYDFIKSLRKKDDLSFFVFRKKDFISNYLEYKNVLKMFYSKFEIAYSYKTNYTPYICNLVKNLNGFAEVTSDFELEIALRLGYPNNRIIYNGPCKGENIESFIIGGGMVNLDNLLEFDNLITIAKKHLDKEILIGIRLHLDLDNDYLSRFGIDVFSDEFKVVYKNIISFSNINIVGLHFHSPITTLNSWEKRINLLLDVLKKFPFKKLKYIDLGSGIHTRLYHDKSVPNINDIRTLKNYGRTILMPLAEYYKNTLEQNKPIVFMEPGTLLIRNCIDFIVQVKSIKCLKGSYFIVVDGSNTNIGNEAYIDFRPIKIVSKPEVERKFYEKAIITGYTCLEDDYLYCNFSGEVAVGDFIVFGDVGAYSYTSKPPFIVPNCPVYSLENEDDKRVLLIKKRESFDEILSTFLF